MDLRVEQVTILFETTRGHMRRLDRAGKGLYITAHDLQVIVGRSRPFYQLELEDHDYIKEKTRWTYLWQRTRQLGLQLHINNFWVPGLSCVGDRNIMDAACTDEVVKKSKWKLLYHINQCRLYTQAFNLSDLTHDGVRVHAPYMDGSQRGRHRIVRMPEVRRPTNNQWRIWKSFLYRNFLSPGICINPPLGQREDEYKPSLPVSETDQILQLPDRDKLKSWLEQIPESLRGFVGKVKLPNDEGLVLSEAIVGGECIGASDGSLRHDARATMGSHGYALGRKGVREVEVTGSGASPRSDSMSSLTTEHCGLIGLLVILHILCRMYLLQEDECFGSVVIWIDNKQVVERSNTAQEMINISDYAAPEQDLWSLTTELIAKLPIRVEIRWIKGHQNQNNKGEPIHGPFTQEVELNIVVDKLANEGMGENEGRVLQRPNLSHSVVSVYDRSGVMINDVRSYISKTMNGQRMQEYILQSKGWDENIFLSVDWEGIEAMMTTTNSIRRIKIVKMMNNWQNTGRQKGKIRDAKLKIGTETPIIPSIDDKTCHLCPAGCNEEEASLHYLHCPIGELKKRRSILISKVLRRLKALRTYEGISAMVRVILTNISHRNEEAFDTDEVSEDGPLSLDRTLRGQEKIGWREFCQGYCHKGWSLIQNRYYRQTGLIKKTLNINRWKKSLVTILGDYSLDCWTMRNEILHGKEKEDSARLRLRNMRLKVKELYRMKNEIRGTKNYKIFDMPQYKRLRFGIQSITIWVEMAEEVLRLHRENMARNTIHTWLQP